MPNPNAIVSTTVALQPPLDRAPQELLSAEAGISVELDDGRRVRLDPADPRSAGFARVLDGLSKRGLPVYLEIDPATNAVTLLLLPWIARVAGINYSTDGFLSVTIYPSHAVHRLRFDNPDFAELERALRDALRGGQPVILVEDDTHNIIDVRAFTPDPDRPAPLVPPLPSGPIVVRDPWFRRVWRRISGLICWSWLCIGCVSMDEAQQAFDGMLLDNCDPSTVPPPCIPFLYPDDGCWARAHEMCRLMINMGFSPQKVWSCDLGNEMLVKTPDSPVCYVKWFWHVAPTLSVRIPGFLFFCQVETMAIDPSLFTKPVPEASWKAAQQGDSNVTLIHTGADQYWWGGETDPTYAKTNCVLAGCRLALQNRSNQQGPPPYAACG